MEAFKAALPLILLVALLPTSMLTSTSTAEAQTTETIILRGRIGAYNTNETGEPPWLWYEKGDLPPIMAAKRLGSGAVVAAGIAATCRNGRWNDASNTHPHLDNLLDVSFQWMVLGAKDVIWYEGYDVYNDATQCSQLISVLGALGYNIASNGTEPIASMTLSDFDILVIPQLQLGALPGGTGPGDPDLLPDADIEAIKNFVERGGGLLVMEAADFGAHNFYKVQNKILEAFDFSFGFQSDEIVDDDNPWGEPYEPLADVDVTTEIGTAYESATGTTMIGLYGICSLAPITPSVSVQVEPGYQAGAPGTTLEYDVVVANPETPTAENLTCILTVEDSAGWGPTLSENSIAVLIGESRTVTLNITIPDDAEHCTKDNITVTATSPETGASDNDTCIAHAVTALVRAVDVSISPTEDSGPPGEMLTYTVTVANTGTAPDNYTLAASDNASWALSILPINLSLPAGESDTAMLRVVIPIDAENCTRDNITVSATSTENSEVSDSASCVAHAFGAARKRGVEVSVSPKSKSGAPGEELIYHVEVKNTGESADEYRLEVTNTGGWDSNLSVTLFWLSGAEGSSGKGVLLKIRIPDNAKEGDSSTITVTAFGTGYENHTICTATVSTIVEVPWMLIAVALITAAIIVGAIVVIKRRYK